ncbi:unnamed protein product [Durusdinium trenchii]|uniref:PSI domain-containing protein n=1 Tax=Durusdinium trenchii TaxID=1381693 RepID=A0ABP0QG09_9DINO
MDENESNDSLFNESFDVFIDDVQVEDTIPSCSVLGEYAIRRCTAPRAPRTCLGSRLPTSNGQKRCQWNDRCMRCVPPVGYLNDSGCDVDGVFFRSDGGCPYATTASHCNDCSIIYLQEVCLGLCSETCDWSSLARMRGELCSSREPPPDDSALIFMIALIGGGVVGFILLFTLCRALARMVLAARERAKQRRLKELKSQSRNTGRGTVASMRGTVASNRGTVMSTRDTVASRGTIARSTSGRSSTLDEGEHRPRRSSQASRASRGSRGSASDQDDGEVDEVVGSRLSNRSGAEASVEAEEDGEKNLEGLM